MTRGHGIPECPHGWRNACRRIQGLVDGLKMFRFSRSLPVTTETLPGTAESAFSVLVAVTTISAISAVLSSARTMPEPTTGIRQQQVINLNNCTEQPWIERSFHILLEISGSRITGSLHDTRSVTLDVSV